MLKGRQEDTLKSTYNEGSPPECTVVSGEDLRAYRECLQVRRGDYRHFLCEGLARQERQARLREVFGRKVREAAQALAELQVHALLQHGVGPTLLHTTTCEELCVKRTRPSTSPSLGCRLLPLYTLHPPHLPLSSLPPGSCTRPASSR